MAFKVKRSFVIALLIIFSIAGLFYYKFQKNMAMAGAWMGGEMPPTLVESTKIQKVDWPQEVEATATLVALRGIPIKSEVAGRVSKVYFRSGTEVKEGAPLFQINPDILLAELNQAKAQYRLSETNYRRFQDLYQRQFSSLQELDQSHSDRDVNKAKVEQLAAQLRQLTIRAPFNGRVGLAMVELGDYVNTGDTVTNLQTLNPMRIDFSVPEIYLANLKTAQPVSITTSAYPKETFQGKVYAIDAQVDPNTRSIPVRAEIQNDTGKLLPGMFAQVKLIFDKSLQAFAIPQIAVIYDTQGSYVFRIHKGIAKRIPIVQGERRGDNVEVKSGLNANDEIVVAGQLKLQDGAKVRTH
jgi:membrane fusion protein (multidrug efflux system)